MALTRSMLKGMGLTGEQIDTIIDAHAETVDGLKEERDGYKADAAKVKSLEKKVADLEEENSDLKNSGDDGWKEKHDAVKADFDAYKKDVESKEERTAKEKAYKDVLKDAGLNEKGIEKAVKYADWDSIELDGDKVKDAKNHIKTVKEEWSEYVTKVDTNGALVPNPSGTGGTGGTGKTRDQILAIKDGTERRSEMMANKHLFPELGGAE